MTVTLDIPNETVAIWLSDLFENEAKEAEGAAENEDIFAMGSDDESRDQHNENADLNREYAEILRGAYNDVQKYWDSNAVTAI